MPPAATPSSCRSTVGAPACENVADGLIGATSMQFPLLMAELGVEAIATGEIPANTEGLDFVDTGVELITDNPVEGIESEDTDLGPRELLGLSRVRTD